MPQYHKKSTTRRKIHIASKLLRKENAHAFAKSSLRKKLTNQNNNHIYIMKSWNLIRCTRKYQTTRRTNIDQFDDF